MKREVLREKKKYGIESLVFFSSIIHSVRLSPSVPLSPSLFSFDPSLALFSPFLSFAPLSFSVPFFWILCRTLTIADLRLAALLPQFYLAVFTLFFRAIGTRKVSEEKQAEKLLPTRLTPSSSSSSTAAAFVPPLFIDWRAWRCINETFVPRLVSNLPDQNRFIHNQTKRKNAKENG